MKFIMVMKASEVVSFTSTTSLMVLHKAIELPVEHGTRARQQEAVSPNPLLLHFLSLHKEDDVRSGGRLESEERPVFQLVSTTAIFFRDFELFH